MDPCNDFWTRFILENLLQTVFGLLLSGGVIGVLIKSAYDRIFRARREKREMKKIVAASIAIDDAEEAILGPKRGGERLICAIKKYQGMTGEKDFEKAVEMINKVFLWTPFAKKEAA